MFERRLKIVLGILSCVVFVLIGRAAQVQVFSRDYWKHEASTATERYSSTPTTRGAIKDRYGRVLAVDYPCVDACVEYPALTHPPDPEWVKRKAADRLRARLGDSYQKLGIRQRRKLRDDEIASVQADIDAMWNRLAEVSGKSIDEIQEVREGVIRMVTIRQRFVWKKRAEDALRKQRGGDEDNGGRLKHLLSTDDDENKDSQQVTVTEQNEAHVVLHAIDTAVQNELGKNIDRYPGLVLRPGTHRYYPYGDVAAHVLGNLARVDSKDMELNAHNLLRDYLPNDLIGRSGVEAMCEPALRGTRGQIERNLSDNSVVTKQEPAPGQDVSLSIDIELQKQIQDYFAHATLRSDKGVVLEKEAILHGAAVVLDVKTNQVLALVSYPTFDVNHLDELYGQLHDDDLNDPLRNRATMSQFEPGSTVKPLCGMAGITAGVIGVNEGIECKGYLWLDGHAWRIGRCWIANSAFTPEIIRLGIGVEHHPVPFPHKGHDGNQDGWLTYSDALERSCNVFFESVADRLKIDQLSEWYNKFGLGQPTGIGISEARGRLPLNNTTLRKDPAMRRIIGFTAGIGQQIGATPIQMGNAIATLARNGIWMRPQLLLPRTDGNLPPVKADAWHDRPERTDLHLPPEALAALRDGMWRVVNGTAGTGKALAVDDKLLQSAQICGKTGTAQAQPLRIPVRDEMGKIVRDEKGAMKRQYPTPSSPDSTNPQAPWYRQSSDGKLDHAWYVGFAPRDNPQIAFAVMVEYGGSGGVAAAAVAREALEQCIAKNYLTVPTAAPVVKVEPTAGAN